MSMYIFFFLCIHFHGYLDEYQLVMVFVHPRCLKNSALPAQIHSRKWQPLLLRFTFLLNTSLPLGQNSPPVEMIFSTTRISWHADKPFNSVLRLRDFGFCPHCRQRYTFKRSANKVWCAMPAVYPGNGIKWSHFIKHIFESFFYQIAYFRIRQLCGCRNKWATWCHWPR